MSQQEIETILERARSNGTELVHLQFIDVPGSIKAITIPAARLRACLENGVWFDGSSAEGAARMAESDLYLYPDPSTFAVLPWEPVPAARLVCDLALPNRSMFPADPRNALKAVLAEAGEMGFDYRVASEVEFFVFDDRGDQATGQRAEPIDTGGYFGMPSSRAQLLCVEATRTLTTLGFDVDTTHHEVGPGQYEIQISEMGALNGADAIVTLKWALRALGRRSHLLVSFMPKPIEGISGSGLHIHQLLSERRAGANVFFDPADEHKLSALGRQFIAGQIAHARGMCAVIAPTVNSYKRLAGGAEAPARISWARINRGALIRVPEMMPQATRIEMRAPDPSCNPYLALAVMLKAGLDGVRNDMPLPDPIEEVADSLGPNDNEVHRADPLPQTLGEAIEELDWDPVVRSALGQPIYEIFLRAKEQEWDAYRNHISLWEIENYLEGA